MIKNSSLEQLKNQIDIVDIIGSNLELHKAGANYKVCCPFHGEDTPSFVISPAKQICHCFGCGFSGDSIKFVQEYKRLNFTEAVADIAEFYNFNLEYENNTNTKSNDYKKTIEALNQFYIKRLVDDKKEYLLNRGLTLEIIEEWEIGFAPTSKEQIQYLTSNYFNLKDAEEIGVIDYDSEKKYSRFTHRIMFPIKTHSGKLVGFSGRIINGERTKYINSPTTKLFDKSRVLFGYDKAKDTIYKKGTIVITEGAVDVIMMHQAGIKTAVGTLGTALTASHIPMIKRAGARALIAYDGDNAGRAAAYKASVLLSQHDIDGGVVLFPEGCDPADLIKDDKLQELIDIMKKPINIIKYVLSTISSKHDLSNPHAKNKALSECVNYLKSLPSLIIANEYKTYLASLLNINVASITLGQTQITIQPEQLILENKALLTYQKTLLENPRYLDEVLEFMDFEAMLQDNIDKAICEERYEDECLIPLKIRDDIKPYTKKEFIEACKLRQKDFIKSKIKKLTNSNETSPAVFKQIGELQKKLLGF